MPMPNMGNSVKQWLEQVDVAGVVLSGGNDLTALGGDAPERDETELAAIEWASAKNRPVLGVCRGMQLMAHRAGFAIAPVAGHVAVRHELTGAADTNGALGRVVNSYHNWSIPKVSGNWRAELVASDGSIEFMRHAQLPQIGIMWHPERENPFDDADIAMFKEFFRVF